MFSFLNGLSVFRKEHIDSFKWQGLCLGVEEPDDDRICDIKNGKDDVSPVADVVQCWRCDFDDQEVTEEM